MLIRHLKTLAVIASSTLIVACGSSSQNQSDNEPDIDSGQEPAGNCLSSFSYKKAALAASSIALAACDPSFETTSELCAQDQNVSIIIPAPSTEVLKGADEYELYLEDIFVGLEPQDLSALSADEQAALAFVKTTINSFLNYDENAGTVNSASNLLDFLEDIIATTDPDKEVEAFVNAKRQLREGIDADDDFCSYSNSNIIINDGSEELTPIAFAEWDVSYNPFSQIVQQSILISELREDLDSSETRAQVPFVGFFQSTPEAFQGEGFTIPLLRQAITNSPDLTSSLIVDDGRDNKLGQVVYETLNTYCDPEASDSDPADSNAFDPSTFAECSNGETVRAPVKTQCDGSDPEGKNESNRVISNTFDLGGAFTGYKRVRVEIDYENNQTRFYASDYGEAVLDSDGTTLIKDATGCEKQAILDELADLTPGVGVSLTVVEDPNFDIIRTEDSNGNEVINEPTPLFTYDGIAISDRQ